MRTATVEVGMPGTYLWTRLHCHPNVRVIEVFPLGDGFHLLRVESPLLPLEGHNGTVEAVIDRDGVRFKRAADA